MSRSQTNRRTFLGALATVPGLGFLAPGQATAAQRSSPGRDIIEELGVRPFINAAGTYTAMTGSLMPPEVVAAIEVASHKYVKLTELQDAIGARIADLLQCESAMISAGCASALSLATSACVAGDDPEKIRRLPDTSGMKDEVIIQKTHRVGYDHAVRNAGVRMIEVETREEMESKISNQTAMMFFYNAADPRGKIHHEEFVEVGKKHGVPTLNDAAADVPPVENLWRYTKLGFDLVAFSGGKGMRGPQSSGLLLGRKDLIASAKLNTIPYGDTLCRTNKVNKEEMVGMLVALEMFVGRDHDAVWKDWEQRCRTITNAVRRFDDVQTEVDIPQIANAVPHLRVRWNYDRRGLTPTQMADRLRAGQPSIEVNPGTNGERLVIGVWMMQPGDAEVVGEKIREVLAKT
jgi:uncharacterized pyridoxal phosphate-dependent enzyme